MKVRRGINNVGKPDEVAELVKGAGDYVICNGLWRPMCGR